MRVRPSPNFSGIISKASGAITAVHIQHVPCHPIAFIRGKVESCVRYGIDIAIGMRWNAIEVTLLSRWSVLADAGLNGPRRCLTTACMASSQKTTASSAGRGSRADQRWKVLSPKFANISVPYGALIPTELDNILGAGRHIACDASSHTFLREIPQCWLTGQAAGVAAALAVAQHKRPKDLDARAIQRELLRQGAYLSPAVEQALSLASAAE